MSDENRNQNPAPEAESDLSEILQVRRDKLKALQEAGRDPFQLTVFNRTAYSAEIKGDYDRFAEQTASVAGRIMSKYISFIFSLLRRRVSRPLPRSGSSRSLSAVSPGECRHTVSLSG